MSRKKLSASDESARQNYVDTMLVYLDCADFTPSVKTFIPTLSTMIDNLLPVLKSAPTSVEKPISPIGLITPTHTPGGLFEIYSCHPASSRTLARLQGWLPSVDIRTSNSVRYCLVNASTIYPNGKVVATIPRYYKSNLDEHRRCSWFPVVAPAPIGTVRCTSAGGATGRFTEFEVRSSDTLGFIPRFAYDFDHLQHSVWSVRIQAINGGSSLVLFTDQDGATGFFNLRDAPLTAGGRRAALQHWVTQHNRRAKKKKPIQVTGHLRGVENFSWFGLDCTVQPPTTLLDSAA